MDAKEIRELIELISRSNFNTFELEREGFRLRLVKGGKASAVTAGSQAIAVAPEVALASDSPQAPAATESPDAAPEPGVFIQTSPIVGTFFRSPGPDAPPFAEVGSRVKKGQAICIVEAMKVMNEIEAEIDGEVLEVLVANGQPVGFGEALFRLRPLN